VSCTGGGGGHGSSTSWEAAGLCLAARPEEDEGGQGPVVKKRRGGTGPVGWGVGRWAGRLGSAGLEKKRNNRGKSQKILENCRKIGKARMCT
jgi:hypothetical protein